jgi:membrane protein YdbS with pleckstrin-like domain
MLKRDILAGVIFAAVMWVTIIFVLVVTVRVVDDAAVAWVLTGAAVVLGLFNTLSLMSMISRYRHERHHVYGEDIAHLDASRSLQRAGAGASKR